MEQSGRNRRQPVPLRPRKLRGVRTRSFCTAIRASSRSCWRSRRPTPSGNNGGFPPASPFTLLTCCATVLARAATSPSQPAAPLEAVLGQVHRRAVDALPLPDHRDPLREIRHGPGPGRHADLDRDPGPLCSQAPPSARLVHRRRIEGLITRRIAHVQANPGRTRAKAALEIRNELVKGHRHPRVHVLPRRSIRRHLERAGRASLDLPTSVRHLKGRSST